MQEDEISVDRNTIKGLGGHAWVRYASSDGTVFVVDPAQEKVGRLEDMQETGWDYRRPDDVYPIIGQGSQYKVLDTGRGRVKKIPQSVKKARQLFAKWYRTDTDDKRVIEGADHVLHDRETSAAIVRHLTHYYGDIKHVLGNPRFDNDGSYKQDKITSMEDVLASVESGEAMKLIDNYFALVQTLWMYGIHDKISNFQTSCGLDRHGNVMLADFGEITNDKETAARLLADENWRNADDYQRLPDDLRHYYKSQARVALRSKNFESLWEARIREH
jgi:hypothetical protein